MSLVDRIIQIVDKAFSKTYVDNKGYERYSDSDILVHRVVAGKKLGRRLRPGEVVHHQDRDKLNNNGGNLYVFKNQRVHNRIHDIDKKRFGAKASYKGFNN